MEKTLFSTGGDNLRTILSAARRRAGLTQAELARRLDLPQPFVSHIERGERRVDVVEFYAIALALEIDPVELFTKFIRLLDEERGQAE
ncbi:MAG TPA: helix-turn-helix transcriptional regulator [Sphingomonas sp.]